MFELVTYIMDGSEELLCNCDYQKTRTVVVEYGNICPKCSLNIVPSRDTIESELQLSVSSEDSYEVPITTRATETIRTPRMMPALPTASTVSFAGLNFDIKSTDTNIRPVLNASEPNVDRAQFGSVAPRRFNAPRLEMPHFDGKNYTDPTHFFLKVGMFFAEYNIFNDNEKIRLLSHALDKEALDLYLTLKPDQQANLEELREIFVTHFKPSKNKILGMGDILSTKKGVHESISEYCLRLRKHAKENDICDEIVTAIFLQGFPASFKKHIALKNIDTLDDMFHESLVFEQVSKIDENVTDLSQITNDKQVSGSNHHAFNRNNTYPRRPKYETSFNNNRFNNNFRYNDNGNYAGKYDWNNYDSMNRRQFNNRFRDFRSGGRFGTFRNNFANGYKNSFNRDNTYSNDTYGQVSNDRYVKHNRFSASPKTNQPAHNDNDTWHKNQDDQTNKQFNKLNSQFEQMFKKMDVLEKKADSQIP